MQGSSHLERGILQAGTGTVKWGGSFVGGLASLATDPIAAAKGIYTLAEHLPPSAFAGGPVTGMALSKLGMPMVNPLKAMHGAYDVVVNGQDYNSRMRDRVFNPKASRAEDAKVFNAVGNGLIEPMKKSWEQGKPVEAITQGVLEVVSLFAGLGEAKAGAKVGEVGKIASEVTNVAGKTENIAEATRLAEKTAEVGKGAKGGEAVTKAETAALEAGKTKPKTATTKPNAKTPKTETGAPKGKKVETDASKQANTTEVAGSAEKTAEANSVNHSNKQIAETGHPEFAPASSRDHVIRSADVQPRHFTKLEQAIRFRQIGNPKRAASLLRELKAELGPKRYEMLRSQHLQDLDKGSALHGNVLKGDSYRASSKHIDLMRHNDQFSTYAQKRERLEGYYDVIAHGVENPGMPTTQIKLQTNGREATIDHRALAKLLKNQKGYNGEKVRLLSCLTGNATEAFAQNLARKIKKEVLAPSDIIWAGEKGELPISSVEKTTDLLGRERLAPKTPYDGEWRTSKPKDDLRSAEKNNHPELERSLSKEEMKPIESVPDDRILRAKSPQEFVGNVTGWLGENYPLTRPHTPKIIETDAQLQKLHRTWRKRLEKRLVEEGHDVATAKKMAERFSKPSDTAKGITYQGDIAIMQKTVQRIRSGSVEERIAAMKTITHEWWHAMRSTTNKFSPFEEGSADLFSEIVIREKTGATIDLKHSYKGLKEGAELLRNEFGHDWFLASRNTPNAKQYLRKTFEEAGYPKDKIDLALREDIGTSLDTEHEIWRDRIQDLLQSKDRK
jgi:hypothetical protein